MVSEKLYCEILKQLVDAEVKRAMLQVALEYAIIDIPHTCQFCMSKRCPYAVCDCEGCENGSNWCWYGVMEV